MFLQAFNKIYGKREVVKFGHDVDEKKCPELTWQVSNSRLFGYSTKLMQLKHKKYLGCFFLFFFFLTDSPHFLWDIFFMYDQQILRESQEVFILLCQIT